MDKKQASDFMRVGRAFVSRGGTLILLAHTNKRRDEEKKVIFGGTSDIVDDVDCAFTLDEVNTSETHKIVRFENIKSRGNVELEVSYSYAQNEHDYEKLINSVKKESNYRPKNESAKSDEVGEIINAISEGIKAGITSKTKLVKSVTEETGLSRRKVITVLDKYTGDCWLDGHKWRCELGEHGAKIFKLLDQDESDEDFDAFESECAS